MKITIKKLTAMLCLAVNIAVVNASVCKIVPGSVTCSHGIVDRLSGNGMVTVNGTTISGTTIINGLLDAEDAQFFSLKVNGSAKLTQCTINDSALIKGSLIAFSTKFEKTLKLFSNKIRLTKSKVGHDLYIGHTDSKKQIVYLDNFSEVFGDIIFDDGKGEVIVSRQSKIGGKVIGGHTILK